MSIIFLLVSLVWLLGTCLRIYRQARFYQIEEYMSLRYIGWIFARRDRWLPMRALTAGFGGVIISFILSEAPGDLLIGLIGLVTAIIAVWPPDEGEIKKKFRATPRARRLLGAAFAIPVILTLLYWLMLSRFTALPEMGALRLMIVLFAGLPLFLAAPLFLIAGNLLMTPIETFFRQRFINQAQKVLAQVNPIVIGITGSYGKTSTKTYLAHILNGRYRAYPTPKSYNTLMGLCIAINNEIDHSIDYFIAEMGAYIPGEIERICELTQPSMGIVIEVGPQHLERFGTLENTAAAKYELIKALPPDGVGIFNWDNLYVREMYERGYPATRIGISKEVDPANIPPNGPRFVASDISESLDGLMFTVTDSQASTSEKFSTPLLGQHNVTNILLATAAAINEGMSLRDVAWRVSGLKPAESRLTREMLPNGITVINDAYSANPVGAVQALRVLAMHTNGKRLLITPGMVELGSMMASENRKLGETAAQYATDVILVGEKQTAPIKNGLMKAGFPADRLHVVDTLAESVQWYRSNLQAGDTVLFLNDLPDTYST